MRFRSDNLPLHENGMTIHAWAGDKEIYSKTYYSIGGGFIVDEEHFGKENAGELSVPYPFKWAQEMLGLSLTPLQRRTTRLMVHGVARVLRASVRNGAWHCAMRRMTEA